MVSPLIGQGVAIATKFIPNLRTWFLENLDTSQVIQGQFAPQTTNENVGANWATHTTLGRDNNIIQFLNNAPPNISFEGLFYRDAATDSDPNEKLAELKSWARVNASVRRPPVLHFYVGDGHVGMTSVIHSITNIAYERPDVFGRLRSVSFRVELLKYTHFSLDDEGVKDTRYARAKERDTYELLAQREYGNPLLGDYIRKLHPKQPTLTTGATVRLPSIERVRTQRVAQTSIPLRTGFGQRDTPQRALRLQWFTRRSASKVSHIV